jgi:iron(II)-dependent oxidoreductase
MKKILIAAVLGCLSGAAYAVEFSDLAVKADGVGGLAAAQGVAVPPAADSKAPIRQVEWVRIGGGKFTMGADSGETGFEDAAPAREIAIKTFEMSKTVVTVEQYAECVNAGGCTEPGSADAGCNWGRPDRQTHPVNCVYLSQARQYARFKGARLPSEAEWEYAARSGGREQKYPWGNNEPTCDRAVMAGYGDVGCGTGHTMPVCSKPSGNTAQGLCDMAGNVWQWMQDRYKDSYSFAALDGSANKDADYLQVKRGGSFLNNAARDLRSGHRGNMDCGILDSAVGIRLVRAGR